MAYDIYNQKCIFVILELVNKFPILDFKICEDRN